MDVAARVTLITAVRDRLSTLPWEDADLLIGEYGVASGMPDGDRFGPSIQDVLRAAPEDRLAELGQHFGILPASLRVTARSAARGGPLTLFASHLATHHEMVGAVATDLRQLNIDMLVAHISIDPDQEWQTAILHELDKADAGIAFLHPGFGGSQWCDQEIGWLLGRHLPVFSLLFGETPGGPLGLRQGAKPPETPTRGVTEAVLNWISGRAELGGRLAHSLVRAMVGSSSFAQTDRIWLRLRLLRNLTVDDCRVLLTATQTNNSNLLGGKRY
jgi:hypothetical protein